MKHTAIKVKKLSTNFTSYIKILIIFIIFSASSLLAKSGLEFNGSLYSDLGFFHYINSGKTDSLKFGGKSNFSLKFINTNQKYGKVAGEFDVTIPYGELGEKYLESSADSTKIDSMINSKLSDQIPIFMNLRKLYFSLYFPMFDVTIGRQIINFGKGQIFSPIDVFSSLNISDLNYRRSGSDILNVKIPLSLLSGIDFITEMPFGEKETHSAIKVFHNIFDFDVSAVGIYNQKSYKTTTGITFRGDAIAGIYGEFVENFHKNFDNRDFEIMLGADYSIDNTYFWALEFLHKSRNAGADNLWKRNNFYSSFLYKINDLMSVSTNLIYSYEKNENDSAIFSGQFYYNILQNVDLIFYTRYYRINEWEGIIPDLEYSTRLKVKF
ncbi:MAG: hypothetical protein U9P79_00945 [Candidatus Cloacimonadota bacterium]|nr:hypothetical protein [Candidatus Cloacimonadota bacterium]